jgi:hypothetical protein
MKNALRTSAIAAAGSVVLMLALTTDGASAVAQGMKPLLVQIVNTATEPVPVVTAVERVMLRTQGGAPTGVCPDFTREVQRIMPDGTSVPSFTVPAGKLLTLTDLAGIVRRQTNVPWSVGDVAAISALLGSSSLPAIRAHGRVDAGAVAADIVSVSVHLESGGVFGQNVPVCLAEAIIVENGFKAADLQEASLHGYLIDQ